MPDNIVNIEGNQNEISVETPSALSSTQQNIINVTQQTFQITVTLPSYLVNLTLSPTQGLTTFLQLTDTPSAYTGQGGKVVAVKSDESGLEFATVNSATWGNITGTLSDQSDLQAALDAKASSVHTHTESQITDLDKYTQAEADALLANKQPIDTDLTAIAGITPVNDDIIQRKAGTWVNRTPAQFKSDLGIVEADISDLDKYTQAEADALFAGKQDLDSDLTAIAALTPTNDDILQRKAGAWTNRTMAQLVTDLALTESDITDFGDYIPTSEKGANSGVATLDSGGKIPAAQLPNTVMEFQGTWDADTNTPTLADGTGNAGDVYLVSNAGTQDLGSGSQTYAEGDWLVYNGSIWEKSINSNAVVSVNGYQGVVTLDTDDVSEGTNLYFTTARAITALTGQNVSIFTNDSGYLTGSNNLSDLTDDAAARTNLGVEIGTDVQAHGDVLDDMNTLGASSADNQFLVSTGIGVLAWETGATARASLGLGSLATLSSVNNDNWSGTDLAVANGGTGASNAATARTNLSVYSQAEIDALMEDAMLMALNSHGT